jgi:trans-aconitate 2-methyltransferase
MSTSVATWDPEQYGRFGDERGRAFFELVSRVHAAEPGSVVDLGCGSGELTASLAERWSGAVIEGIDSSPQMIAAAEAHATGGLRFSLGDLADWRPGPPVDVIISNAALHWIPGHRELLPRWLKALGPGGWLAFQVPGNFGEPSHTLLREVCASPRWRDRLAGVTRLDPVAEPGDYLELLASRGCRVDSWETTYLQVLQGDDAVLEWVKGTTLRPVLSTLEAADGTEFLREYGARLREAYPARPHGTVFPFRRIFVVAQRIR